MVGQGPWYEVQPRVIWADQPDPPSRPRHAAARVGDGPQAHGRHAVVAALPAVTLLHPPKPSDTCRRERAAGSAARALGPKETLCLEHAPCTTPFSDCRGHTDQSPTEIREAVADGLVWGGLGGSLRVLRVRLTAVRH